MSEFHHVPLPEDRSRRNLISYNTWGPEVCFTYDVAKLPTARSRCCPEPTSGRGHEWREIGQGVWQFADRCGGMVSGII